MFQPNLSFSRLWKPRKTNSCRQSLLSSLSRSTPTSQSLSSNPNPNPYSVLPTKPHLGLISEPTTYTQLLLRSTKTKSLYIGELVHSLMIRASHKPSLLTYNILLNMYCKCGDMFSAQQLYDKMPERDTITWTSLISGYSQTGSFRNALNLFKNAIINGIELNNYSYATALNACAQAQNSKHGKIIHGLVVINGFINTPFVINSLMDMYSKLNMIDQVRLMFDHAKELDENSWNLLLSSYSKIGWYEVVLHILVWMHRVGIRLNSFALCTVLKAIIGTRDSKEIQKMVHGCVVKIGLDLDLFVGSSMVDLYAKNGGLEEAIQIFENISNPDLIVLNAMIAGFARLGNEMSNGIRIEGLKLYREIIKRRFRPSKCTLKSVLEVCTLTNSFEFGKRVHAHVILNGFQNNGFINCALISLYSNSGMINDSLKCLELGSKNEIFVYSSMITAFIQNGYFEKAFSLFKEILCIGLKPDSLALTGLINGLTDSGFIQIGEQIHGYLIKSRVNNLTICCNSMIGLYSKIGDVEASIRVFEEIECLDAVSWENMILGFGINGREREALDLFEKMRKSRVKMDKMVYLAVLITCSNGNFFDEGFRYYEKMLTNGISPNTSHISRIIDLLGKDGKLNELDNLITGFGSKLESGPLILHALLRAARFHRDKERSVSILEKLMEVEPLNASNYIILYNIYMNIGKFSLAMKTRGLMRQRGAVKEPGFSWVETRPVKLFTDENENNYLPPLCDSIYTKIKGILVGVKERNENNERDIWEMEFHCNNKKLEGDSVKLHGELLAVCLGLTGLKRAVSPVLKNQRIRDDCHEVLKILSESEEREILVRDPTRLHRFNKGFCSCGDYW